MSNHRFTTDQLEEIATTLFRAAGATEAVAGSVARLLVESERMGHPSHGLLRIPDYLGRIEAGRLIPDAGCAVVSETPVGVMLDGGWGFGQVAAVDATNRAIEKAAEHGMGVAGAYHINHVGRLGDFTEMAADRGMIAFAFVGGTPTGQAGNVAPFGGREAVWGTNPLAIAVPTGGRPFSLDFATSVIAGGKAAAARARGEQLEEEFLIDREGLPTRDPSALLDGGAIRPFGDHKGYALAFAVELIAGALVGAAAPELTGEDMHNGFLILVMDPGALADRGGYLAAVDGVVRRVKDSLPADGFEEVLVPGEREAVHSRRADSEGIDLPDAVVRQLMELAAELGVGIPV